MSSQDELNLLVISDLHCRHSPPMQPDNSTRLHSNSLPIPWKMHPVEALKRVITSDELKAAIILCPGDIADKSDDQGYLTGYGFLKSIKQHIKASHLISTIGNHDVDSRDIFKKTFDHIPKNLDESFPFDDVVLVDKFWKDNFCLIQRDSFAVLVFNSAYSHTGKDRANKSLIEDHTLEKMEDALKGMSKGTKFKIGLCHHHPNKHSNMNYKDEDVIEKGDLLLKLLNKYNFQILIHGHKHDPRLNYFNALPVLCAGSFSSLQNVRELSADNVFHLIKLKANSKNGQIRSYLYGPSNGWHVKHGAYFPCYTGFGYQGDLSELAQQCLEWLEKKGEVLGHYKNLVEDIPVIQNLIPDDQTKFNGELESIGLKFTPEFPDLPTYIAKVK